MPRTQTRRETTLAKYADHVNPARASILKMMGMDLVADRSEGYRIWDVDGSDYLDLDLRAGVYNLGHRNPQVIAALRTALGTADMGFALFPGEKQALLAEKLAASTTMKYTLFAPSGTEANDMAVQVARRITGNRRIISCGKAYHGATGLASAAGNPEFAARFNSVYPEEFAVFEVGDIEQISAELSAGDVAAVLIEPTCNAAAYPSVNEEFWPELRRLCCDNSTLLIMDEIVTGLGRTGHPWGFQRLGIKPDMVVSAKGLSGGVYPIAALMLSAECGGWLAEDFAGFAGTFAGGELACAVGLAALELSTSDNTLNQIAQTADYFGTGLSELCKGYPWVKEVRQVGLLYSLILDRSDGGLDLITQLFKQRLLTFPAAHASEAVNIKLGHLIDSAYCDEALERIDKAMDVYGATL